MMIGKAKSYQKSTNLNNFFTKFLHNSNNYYPSIHSPWKKSENNGDLGLKMTIFVTAPFEAEIPRFSDQSQRNSKKA